MRVASSAFLALSLLPGCTLFTDFDGVSGGARPGAGGERAEGGVGSGGVSASGGRSGTGASTDAGGAGGAGGATAGGGTGVGGVTSSGGASAGGASNTAGSASGGAAPAVEGGGAVEIVVDDVVDPRGLFIDAGRLYVASRGGGIYGKMLPDGTTARVDTLQAPAAAPFDLVVLGDDLVWSDAGGTVYARAVAGGAARYIGSFSGDELYVAAGADAVFLTGPGAEAVLRATVGNEPQGASLFIVPAGNGGIAWNDGVLYWGSAAPPAGIEEGDDQGGSHRNLVRDATGVGGVAARGGVVAWIGGARRVELYDMVTRAARTVYTSAAPIGGGDVALDDAFVYWSEPANGVVRRAPR